MSGSWSRVSRRTVLGTGITLALAGCLNYNTATDVTDAHLGEPVATASVAAIGSGGDRYDPTLVHVEPGATVTWQHHSGVHDVVAYHPDNEYSLRVPPETDAWASDLLQGSDDTFSHRFDDEGVYDYLCTPHEHVGMVGRVIVGWPDPTDEAALAADSDALPRQAANRFADLDDATHDVLS